jgi:hypothetical protein
MEITFAIITDGCAAKRVDQIIDSIEALSIPTYEILVVGGGTSTVQDRNARHVFFNEWIHPQGWITAKKNRATDQAQYEQIVYLHDYHVFDSMWYRGVESCRFEWDVQMHAIRMQDGTRMLDWLIYDHPVLPRYTPIPYDRHDFIPHQYISGGYWMAKKQFMLDNPLNESLMSHQGEDVEWSLRIRDKARIVMNPAAMVFHNKPHRELHYQPNRMMAAKQYDEFFNTGNI